MDINTIINHQLKHGSPTRLTTKQFQNKDTNAPFLMVLQDYFEDINLNKDDALNLLNQEINRLSSAYPDENTPDEFEIAVREPFNGTISQFSIDRFGDAHYLDNRITKLQTVLSKLYNVEPHLALAKHGLIDERLGSGVLTIGLAPLPGITRLYKNAELLNVDVLKDQVVWVFENNNTLSRFELAGIHIKALSAEGMPNTLVQNLVKRMVQAGVIVKYHGDMDKHGLKIASFFKSKLGIKHFPLMNEEIYKQKVRTISGRRLLQNGSVTVHKDFYNLLHSVSQYPIFEEDFTLEEILEVD